MNLTFGEKIKDARKSKNLTQKQLAEKIGAKHNSVSASIRSFASGTAFTASISQENMQKAEAVIGVSISLIHSFFS